MKAIASFVTGRRTKWVVLAVWVAAVFALFPLGSKLSDETKDDTTSFLPESAESTAVVKKLDQDFPGGETTLGLLIYHREGGLTAADRKKIADDAAKIAAAKKDVPLTE